MGDPENGGRFTVKKYHSAKTVSPPALVSKFQLLSVSKFQLLPPMLLPLNPDYDLIPIAPH